MEFRPGKVSLHAGWEGTAADALEPGWRQMATIAERRAGQLVAVRSGETKRTISAEVHRGGPERLAMRLVASGAGRFLEGGTVHMRAQPFIRPAAIEAAKAIGR